MNKTLQIVVLSLTAGLLIGCKPKTEQPKTEQCTQFVAAATCQKIGQLLIVGFGGMDADKTGKTSWDDPNGQVFKENSIIAHAIADWHIGGVIYFRKILRTSEGGIVRDRNILNSDQLHQLSSDLQAYNAKIRQQQQLPPLPLIISIDQEGGMVNPLVFVATLPNFTAQSLGTNQTLNSADPKKLQAALAFSNDYGKKIGKTLRSLGINLNFAPDADVNINPVNPIIGGLSRSFSDDPKIVVDQTAQIIDGMHSEGAMATLKHFPGHGSSSGDTHKGLVDVTNTYQMEKELYPFKTAIERGYDDFIMSTHVINGQIDRTQCAPGDPNNPATWCPGTMSYKTLTELLRNQLHFKGVIISDDMSMGAIAANYPLETALEKGLNAGIDMFIIANHDADYTGRMIITIAKLVHDGKVAESRIDDAYQHVVAAKQKIGATNG
jgi:beta-N-acetylhexosaminidase